jgi:hypothetical protein
VVLLSRGSPAVLVTLLPIPDGVGAAPQGPGQIESFPLVLGSEPVRALKAELALLQNEEARLAETLGDRHPDMVRVRQQIRSTEEKIRDAERRPRRYDILEVSNEMFENSIS